MPRLADCSPGIYRFAHEASGYFYIGSTLTLDRRRHFWRSAVGCVGCGFCGGQYGTRRADPAKVSVSPRVRAAFREVGCFGWRFDVLERFPADVRADFLWAAELRHIEAGWLSADPSRSLNLGRTPPNFLHQWDMRFESTGGRDPRLVRRQGDSPSGLI